MLQVSKIILNAASYSQAIVSGNGDRSPVVGVLDEPYSAKPARKAIGWKRFQPMYSRLAGLYG
jgi:hypothetical protein